MGTVLNFVEEKVMRNIKKSSKLGMILGIILCVLVFLPCGCGRQLGETNAEARRRHIRNDRIAGDAMRADFDSIMLWDTPTGLTEKRIP